MKSLDLVVLCTAVVKRYGLIPFDQFYEGMQDTPAEVREVTVTDFVDFICGHHKDFQGVIDAPSARSPVIS